MKSFKQFLAEQCKKEVKDKESKTSLVKTPKADETKPAYFPIVKG